MSRGIESSEKVKLKFERTRRVFEFRNAAGLDC